MALALLEASFHVNNFALFYSAAVAAERKDEELTSITMRPALVEGFESGVLFTGMLVKPEWVNMWMVAMGMCVGVGIGQRVWATAEVLGRKDGENLANKGDEKEE